MRPTGMETGAPHFTSRAPWPMWSSHSCSSGSVCAQLSENALKSVKYVVSEKGNESADLLIKVLTRCVLARVWYVSGYQNNYLKFDFKILMSFTVIKG